jgi:hypothetical protein
MSNPSNDFNAQNTSLPLPVSTGAIPGSSDYIEQERYTDCYNRILPLIRARQLDFGLVAKQAGMKERRVREVLLYRLMPGDMVQLLGRKEGICYLCFTRMHGLTNKEPLCLLCLRNITTAVEQVYAQGLTNQALPPEEFPAPPSSPIPVNTVPWEQYEAVLQEVNQYRDKYGPLLPAHEEALEATLSLDDAPAEPATTPEQPVASDNQTDPLLSLLGMDDSDEFTTETPPANGNDAPIRHFGFQRIRARH